MTTPKPPMSMATLGPKIGIPPGKKFSVLNLARAGSAAGAAKKRRPKPGQSVSPTYSY